MDRVYIRRGGFTDNPVLWVLGYEIKAADFFKQEPPPVRPA